MTKRRKGSVSQETFDEFLADQGVLETCEDHAIEEIIGDEPSSVVFDFIERGRRAQEAVDRVLAEEAKHRRTPRPKGKA
jgi:hypothetical protein